MNISWFDEKAAQLTGQPSRSAVRCGFGRGEITVAVSGRLYPCERLVGDDDDEHNPMALASHLLEGDDFLDIELATEHPDHNCRNCAMLPTCSNYILSDSQRTDHLINVFNQACLNETAKIVKETNLLDKPECKKIHQGPRTHTRTACLHAQAYASSM